MNQKTCIHIYNDEGIIDTDTDGFIDCIYIDGPFAIDWVDGTQGTVTRYFISLPFHPNRRKEIQDLQNRILKIECLPDFMESGFLDLLKTGIYEIELLEKDFDLSVVRKKDHHNDISDSSDLQHKSSLHYYPTGKDLIFTQSNDQINAERLMYYKKIILDGQRPVGISIRMEDTNYLLDGHHKLLAYQSLNITPKIIQIEKVGYLNDYYLPASILSRIVEHLDDSELHFAMTFGIDAIDTRSVEYTECIDHYIDTSELFYDQFIISIKSIWNDTNSLLTTSNMVHNVDYTPNLKWIEARFNKILERKENGRPFRIIHRNFQNQETELSLKEIDILLAPLK